MDKYNDFKISNYRDGYVIYNTKGGREKHTHINKKHICKLLIQLISKGIIPSNPYLKESARRISRNENYISEIEKG